VAPCFFSFDAAFCGAATSGFGAGAAVTLSVVVAELGE
jgi:hypothetical protein